MPIGLVLAERSLFLPSLGAMLLLTEVLHLCVEGGVEWWARARLSPESTTSHPHARAGPHPPHGSGGRAETAAVTRGALVVLCAVYAGLTVQRAPVWKDNTTLMRSSLVLYPNNPMALHGLGCVCFPAVQRVLGLRVCWCHPTAMYLSIRPCILVQTSSLMLRA